MHGINIKQAKLYSDAFSRYVSAMKREWKEPDLNHSKHILTLNCFQCLLEVLFIGSNLLGKSFSSDEFSLVEPASLPREIRILRMSCMDNLPEDYDVNMSR
jgi:hypothetical protein